MSIAAAIVGELEDGTPQDRRTITKRAVERLGANPSTVASIIQALARFGVIDRSRNHTVRITALGARWWHNR